MDRPQVVSPSEWQAARERLLVKEKEATRARDALAAERRRLPMVRVEKDYAFEGSEGEASLLDLFDGRSQLIVYRFFFEPGVAGWPESGCTGCSMFVDNIGHFALPHLHARDTSLVLTSPAPQDDIERLKRRMGWTIPWFTTTDDFSEDFDVPEYFGLNVFLRDGDEVFRTYFTTGRAAEAIGGVWSFPRPDTARAPGRVGGLPRELPAGPAVLLVAPARRVRRRDEWGEMSEHEGYQAGVPCWVAAVLPDPEEAVDFYAELFGWEARETMPPDSPGKYFICTLRDRDVAAVGSERGGDVPSVPAWGTYVWVESADDAVAEVTKAGGSVVMEPFDLLDAARVAVVADPSGAVFGVWQPRSTGARRSSTSRVPGRCRCSTPATRRARRRFYDAVFGWDTLTFDAWGRELTMWRMPGYVGGEPGQPVPPDVVAVMAEITGEGSPAVGQAGLQPLLARAEDAAPHWSVNFWVPTPTRSPPRPPSSAEA